MQVWQKKVIISSIEVIFLVILAGTCFPFQVEAQAAINEVNPTPTQGNDWIELYNNTNYDTNLTGWSLEDSSSTMTPSPSFTNLILKAKSFVVIEVGNRLNTGTDQVKLIMPSGEGLEFFTYDHTSPDMSWSRIVDGSGNLVMTASTRGYSNALTTPIPSPSMEPSPNPTLSPSPIIHPAPSPFPSPSPPTELLPTHIVISELMACPNTSESEWVELQNLDNTEYTLSNWQLKDSSNNSRYFTTQISAQGLTVIQISPAMLNNTGGDQLLLIRPDGFTTSSAVYSTCVKGESLVFDGQNWVPTSSSPGLGNPDLESATSEVATMSAATVTQDQTNHSGTSSPTLEPSPQHIETAQFLTPQFSAPESHLSPFANTSSTSAALHKPLVTTTKPAHSASLTQYIPYFLIVSGGGILLVSALVFYVSFSQQTEDTDFNF